jgi:hypothetical protein
MIRPFEVNYISADKFTGKNPKAFMIEDYLYIINPGGTEYVNIRGIFEDPEEVSDFIDCGGAACYTGASPFPMPMDMVQAINQGMMSGELRLLSGTFSDTTLDRGQDLTGGAPQTAQQPAQE